MEAFVVAGERGAGNGKQGTENGEGGWRWRVQCIVRSVRIEGEYRKLS